MNLLQDGYVHDETGPSAPSSRSLGRNVSTRTVPDRMPAVQAGARVSRLRKYRPTLLSHELDQSFQRGISHSLEYGPVNFGFRTYL
jgi:hypothetical protein